MPVAQTKQTVETVNSLSDYKYGWSTDIETDTVPKGLNEDIIKLISSKKNEPQWMLDWRLKAYKIWLTMEEPDWSHITFPEKIDYQDLYYYSAPKSMKDKPKSLDELDPKLLETYNKFKLNIKKNLREKQIEALNIALSNTNETKKMKSILKNNIMQSARYEISNNGNFDVISKVFDDLYHYNNKNIFIKCDTEGHEYEVIQGMQKNLKNNKCLIQIEILDRNFLKLNLLLNRLDYKLIKKGLDKDSYFYVKL